jgi:hypothetical protein
MAILPVSRLKTPLTRDEVMEDLIELGDALKLRASSWRGVARWMLIGLSEMGSRLTVQISAIAAHSYNDTAWGYGLTRKSKSDFDNDRNLGTKARGILVGADDGSVGPVTWPAYSKVFSGSGEWSTYKFTNVAEVTIPLDSAGVEFTVEGTVIGADHNDVPDSIEWDISPVTAGIEITNPPNDTGLAANWITSLGTDREEDVALRGRNTNKWATLGGNPPSAAYEYWAKSATDGSGNWVGITRAYVPDPPGDGTITIYIATASGVPDAGQIADVLAYINARKSKMVTAVYVLAASPVVVTATVTVYVISGSQVTETDVVTAIDRIINSTPIGGTKDGGTDTLVFDDLVVAVKDLDRQTVIRTAFTSPTGNTPIAENEIAVGGAHVVTLVEV